MAGVSIPEPGGGAKARVTIVAPSGRQHLWAASDSAVMSWSVGEIVTFRNRQWRVLDRRSQESDTLMVTLGLIESARD